MRIRPTLLASAAVIALAAPFSLAGAATTTPGSAEFTDPANDGNLLNGQGVVVNGDHATPAGSQAYADVIGVVWSPKTVTTKVKGKKVTSFAGFTVTTTLSGPPTPPPGTSLVYRMLGQVNGDAKTYLGPVYYTTAPSGSPQSALRDNIGPDGTTVTRLTPLALPVIAGSTITWTVPVSALPKEFKLGGVVNNLFFTTVEIEDFHGQKVPDPVPTYGGATGLGFGTVDNGSSTASFKIG